MDQYGKYTPLPLKLNSLSPLQNDGLKTFLFFWEDLFTGAMLNFGGVHENLPFLFILVQRKLDHHLSFVVDDCGKKDSELVSTPTPLSVTPQKI